MSVSIAYTCGGCHVRTEVPVSRVTTPIFKSMQGLHLEGGYCQQHWPGVVSSLPQGWGICVIGCVYCPRCIADVIWRSATDKTPPKQALP